MHPGIALRKELVDEKQKETRLARLEELENEILEQATGVLLAFLAFHEVTHDQVEPPAEWIERFGAEAALKRLAVAKAGWLPASVAPAAVTIAGKVHTGIQRGRAHRQRVTQNTLNVKIALPAATTRDNPGPVVYEVRELEE